MKPVRHTTKPHSVSEAGRLWTLRFLFGALLVFATLTAYLPALRGDFLWDDDSWTSKISGLLAGVSGLRQMWTHLTALQQYYPLTGSTFWLDYHLWGFSALPYHIENVLLHCLASLLFWRLLHQLRVPGAALAAAIFALHPVMVESVGWVTERKNVLSLVFYLGALLSYGRFVGFWNPGACGVTWRRRVDYTFALLLALAAVLAKATAFSVPFVILLICWWKRGRVGWRDDVLPSLPFFALVIASGLVTAWVEKHHVGATGPDWSFSFPERLLIAGRALSFYAGKLVWPGNLCFVYPRWHLDTHSLLQWLYPISAATVLVGLWSARARIGRGPVTVALFFAGTLFPLLGFMNAYFMRYSFVCDHWVYISSLGPIALIAALVVRAGEAARVPALPYGFAAITLPILGFLTFHQAAMYANTETLWRTTSARNPDSFLAHNNLGVALAARGLVDEAIAEYGRALEVRPDYAESLNNLGNALLRKGRIDQAIDQFRKASQSQPDDANIWNNLGKGLLQNRQTDEAASSFKKALALQPQFADAQNNLGVALLRKGQLDDAAQLFRQALGISPSLADAWYNLGYAALQRGQPKDAIPLFQKSLEIRPEYPEAHADLGKAFLQNGDLDGAIAQFQSALELHPDVAETQYQLGVALARQGKLDQAIERYQKATQLEPGFAEAHGNLAKVLTAQGRLDEAILHYRKTLELVPNSVQGHYRLGQALLSRRDFTGAGREFKTSLELDPNHSEAQTNLSWLLATCPDASVRDGAKALALSTRVAGRSETPSPELLHITAAAYAESGRFTEAVSTAEKALAVATAQTNTPLANALHAQLQFYRSGLPFRDPVRP
jgi:tetratricopeptide (TPR) repeat protein